MSDWWTPLTASDRWPHLKLTAPYIPPTWEGERVKGSVSISPGCNCVLLTTYVNDGTRDHYGSYGGIDTCGSCYTQYVDRGLLTDLRSFVPFYRTFPKDCAPGTPAIPNNWEKWLDACERAFAAFGTDPPSS